MADRTGFEHDLAEAVATATRDVRLASPGDVIRLGRRRSRARRGRMAVAGVAVLGGAYGAVGFVGSAPPEQGKTSPAASAGVHGDGMLPVEQWPWYGTEHWKVKETAPSYGIAPWMETASKDFPAAAATFHSVGCEKLSIPDMNSRLAHRQLATLRTWEVPVKGKQVPEPDAGESVYTYPAAASAQQALADTKELLKAPCAPSGRLSVRPGVTTDYGISWVLVIDPQADGGKGPVEEDHEYLVVEGDRVAVLTLSATGDVFAGTAHDADVLAGMRAALAG